MPDVKASVPAEATIEQETMRRVTRRLLPLIMLLYLVSYIDRSNLSFAALTMNHDLGFGHAVFGAGASFFFVGYVAFQLPGNLILHRLGARRVIAVIVLTWGLAATSMGLVRTDHEFYTVRFLLGTAEAAFFPGMIVYIALWFPAAYRGSIIAMFTMASPISNMIGLPFSALLGELNGVLGLKGWQWIFFAQGLPAALLAIPAWLLLTDRPGDANWLSARQRTWLVSAMNRDVLTREVVPAKHEGVKTTFLNLRVWLLCIPYFGIIMGYYGLALWLPQIVKGFGHLSNWEVGLLSTLPYVCAVALLPWWGTRLDKRGSPNLHAAVACLFACLGLAASAWLGGTPALALAALCVGSVGLHLAMPAFWSLPQGMLSGSAAAIGVGMISAIGHLGGIAGPSLMGWLREATGKFQVGLTGLAIVLLVAAATCLLLKKVPRSLEKHGDLAVRVTAK